MDKITLELTVDQAEFLAVLVGVMCSAGSAPIMKMLGRGGEKTVVSDVYDTLSDAGVNIHRVLKGDQFGAENPELDIMSKFWREFAFKVEEKREKREEKVQAHEQLVRAETLLQKSLTQVAECTENLNIAKETAEEAKTLRDNLKKQFEELDK